MKIELKRYSVYPILVVILFSINCERKSPANPPQEKAEGVNSQKVEVAKFILSEEDQRVVTKLDGSLLKAVSIAYEKFRTDEDIPEAKRLIENYEVTVKDDSRQFFIYFIGRRTDRDSGTRGGESEFGKDVVFSVEKKSFRLTGKAFFK